MSNFAVTDPSLLMSLAALCAEPGTWTEMLAPFTSTIGVAASLFVAGLVSGFTHCGGMCGPFVLMRVVDGRALRGAEEAGIGLRRLRRAALWRYHLGRAATYAMLGAAAAGGTGVALDWAGLRWMALTLMVIALAAVAVRALRLVGLIKASGMAPSGQLGSTLFASLVARAGRMGDFPLGVLLGFLPCGLVYGAVAAAASTGSAPAGGLAMAAFAMGTAPGLVAVGLGGAFLARRPRTARLAMLPLLVLNVAIVTSFALRAMA